jgi:hypothetical protein
MSDTQRPEARTCACPRFRAADCIRSRYPSRRFDDLDDTDIDPDEECECPCHDDEDDDDD